MTDTLNIEKNNMKKENELDSTYGLSDEELTERFKASIEIDRKICKIKGLPIDTMIMNVTKLT